MHVEQSSPDGRGIERTTKHVRPLCRCDTRKGGSLWWIRASRLEQRGCCHRYRYVFSPLLVVTHTLSLSLSLSRAYTSLHEPAQTHTHTRAFTLMHKHSLGTTVELSSCRRIEYVDTQRSCAPSAPGRIKHSAVRFGSSMIVFGGFTGSENLNDCWEYGRWTTPAIGVRVSSAYSRCRCHVRVRDDVSPELVSDRWTCLHSGSTSPKSKAEGGVVTGSVPEARSNHTCVLYGGSMVLFGGSSEESYYDDVWSFNLQSGWHVWAQMCACLERLLFFRVCLRPV
jgi:Kelch motif